MLYKAFAKQRNFWSPSPFLLERKLIASGEDRISWNSDSNHVLQEFYNNDECFLSCAVRMAAIWPQQRGRHFLSTPSLDQHILSPHTDTHTQIRKYRWTHTHKYANTDRHAHTQIHANIRRHTLTRTDTNTHRHKRKYPQTHTHTQTTYKHSPVHRQTGRHTIGLPQKLFIDLVLVFGNTSIHQALLPCSWVMDNSTFLVATKIQPFTSVSFTFC